MPFLPVLPVPSMRNQTVGIHDLFGQLMGEKQHHPLDFEYLFLYSDVLMLQNKRNHEETTSVKWEKRPKNKICCSNP